MICCDHDYDRPSLRAVGSTLRSPTLESLRLGEGVGPDPPAWKRGRSRAGSRASSGVPSASSPRLRRGTGRTSSPCHRPLRYGSASILDFGCLLTIDDIALDILDFAVGSLVLESFSASFQSAFPNPHSAIGDPVARPVRLSEQARPSSWFRDSNS